MTAERDSDLGAMFYALTNAMIEAERPILERHDISMWEYVVLVALERRPASQQSELAVRTNRDQTRLIKELDRLQDARLIERVPDPDDRRARVVTITAAGERLLRAVRAEIRAMEDEFLTVVPERDRAILLRVLHRLSHGL